MPNFLDYFSAIGTPLLQGAVGVGTNVMQRNMMVGSQKWQESMMRYQNHYNSPSQMRLRNIQAGIAPGMGSQGSVGVGAVGLPQLSTPDFGGFSDSSSKLRAADFQEEQIRSLKEQNYRSGIDSMLYMQEKLIQLNSALADLEQKGLDSDESRLRYDIMMKQFEHLNDTYDALVEREYLTNENISQSTQRSKDEVMQAWKSLEIEFNSVREMIRHNKVSEGLIAFSNATDRMNAVTNRMNAGTYGRSVSSQLKLNDKEIERVEGLIKEQWFKNYVYSHTVNDEVDMVRLERLMSEYTVQERQAAAVSAMIQAEWDKNKSASFLANSCLTLFGLNTSETMSALMMLGIGVGAAQRASNAIRQNKMYNDIQSKTSALDDFRVKPLDPSSRTFKDVYSKYNSRQ